MQEVPWKASRIHFRLKRVKWGVKGGVDIPVRKPHLLGYNSLGGRQVVFWAQEGNTIVDPPREDAAIRISEQYGRLRGGCSRRSRIAPT